MAIDPVCKMQVDEKNPSGGKTQYKGQLYYFCGAGCRKSFEKDPERYLSAKK